MHRVVFEAWRVWRAAAGAFALGLAVAAVPTGPASGQTVGLGASPGRAAYRPESQWNTGPFYTVPHVNPYLPHRRNDNFLMETDAPGPPYNLAPRGHYDAFSPGRGPVYPYAEGFSPYSGYADWYLRAHHYRPTEKQVERAIDMYFRSGGPRVNVIDPAAAALTRTAPAPSATSSPTPRPRADPPTMRVYVPAGAKGPAARGITVYRGAPSR
jgi:hypothetical protein